MMRREEDPLACLEGIHASIARMNEEGRRIAPIPPLSYMHLVVIPPAVGHLLVMLNDLEKWDGERETFKLWWLHTQIWVKDMLEQSTGEERIYKKVVACFMGKALGFALQVYEM